MLKRDRLALFWGSGSKGKGLTSVMTSSSWAVYGYQQQQNSRKVWVTENKIDIVQVWFRTRLWTAQRVYKNEKDKKNPMLEMCCVRQTLKSLYVTLCSPDNTKETAVGCEMVDTSNKTKGLRRYSDAIFTLLLSHSESCLPGNHFILWESTKQTFNTLQTVTLLTPLHTQSFNWLSGETF